MRSMRIVEDDLSGSAIAELLREHLAGMVATSPAGEVSALDLQALKSPEITFWSVWDGPAVVGCGALKELDPHTGEIKSMRTSAAHLRRGAASLLLSHLIDVARSRRYTRLNLETGSGPPFDPAHALYTKLGFSYCGAFGEYRATAFNRFMTLEL